jgi:hypothetical protein
MTVTLGGLDGGESMAMTLGGLDGGESMTMTLGGLDGGESMTMTLGGLDGGESMTVALGGLDGGESMIMTLGGLDGGESVMANAEPAIAQPVIKAIRLTFIMISPNVVLRTGDMRDTEARLPAEVRATTRAESPHPRQQCMLKGKPEPAV